MVASEVVRLLGAYHGLIPYFFRIQPAWVPPLLKFLPLCENFPITESPPHPEIVALRILSFCPQDADFGAVPIPTLISILSTDHPLQSRKLALTVFCRYVRGWFSSQTETISDHHLDKLLRAVGDPFHFPPEPPQDQDGEPERTVYYEPMEAVVALVEFASSGLWLSHLHPSNFASCGDFLSTDEGRNSALRGMFSIALEAWPEFLCTPAKIVTAVGHLQELRSLRTAEVVITWAWVTGMADVVDCNGRNPIEDLTLRFYRTHGIQSLASLKRWIIRNFDEDRALELNQIRLFAVRYGGPPFRVGRSRRPSQLLYQTGGIEDEWEVDRVISQACRLRRLYHLFGYDPTTWQEAVGVEAGEEGKELFRGRSVTPDMDGRNFCEATSRPIVFC